MDSGSLAAAFPQAWRRSPTAVLAQQVPDDELWLQPPQTAAELHACDRGVDHEMSPHEAVRICFRLVIVTQRRDRRLVSA